jgi:hypothetical protein
MRYFHDLILGVDTIEDSQGRVKMDAKISFSTLANALRMSRQVFIDSKGGFWHWLARRCVNP